MLHTPLLPLLCYILCYILCNNCYLQILSHCPLCYVLCNNCYVVTVVTVTTVTYSITLASPIMSMPLLILPSCSLVYTKHMFIYSSAMLLVNQLTIHQPCQCNPLHSLFLVQSFCLWIHKQ